MENRIALKIKKNLDLNHKIEDSNLKKNIIDLKKNFLDKNKYHLIIRNFEKNERKFSSKVIKFSKLLGNPLPQNKSGKKYVIVKPNLKLLKLNAKNNSIKLRYHQTNKGGAIHSDGPQLSIPPKYLIMGCIKQSDNGGSSIISSALKIYKHLSKKKPNLLKVLKKKFFLERRGFNFPRKNILEKAIFEKRDKHFRFRYLREYIEAGYKIKNKKLKNNEITALDYLDKLLFKKQFQKIYRLNKGDIIILNNNFLAHGRSGFKLNRGKQRSLIRIWIK